MASYREFEAQLENFRHEATVAAQYLYSDMTVQHAASKSKKLLDRLNDTPTFWLAHSAASQCAAYVSLGRVFDTTSDYNIDALLNAFESHLDIFAKEALANRKREGQSRDPEWLPEYLAKAHYPTVRDVRRLRKKVAEYRAVYDRAVKPARHKYLAHREKVDRDEVRKLFGRGKIRELWRLVTFLHSLHEALWNQLHNGHKPVLRARRFSVVRIYDGDHHGSAPHERIVAETKKLLTSIEAATPNHEFERSGKHRGPSLVAASAPWPAAQRDRKSAHEEQCREEDRRSHANRK